MNDIAPRRAASIPSPRMGSHSSSTHVDAIKETAPGLRLIPGPTAAPDRLIAKWQTAMQADGLADRTVTEWAAIVRRTAAATAQHPAAFTPDALTAYLARHRNLNTKGTYYRGLHAWHTWLLRAGHRVDDPMAGLRHPRVPTGEPHPISTTGLERLLSVQMYRRTRAMILLGAYEGLRCAEIARVRAEDVDLDVDILRVPAGKGGHAATLPLHELVAAITVGMPQHGWWFPSPVDKRRPVNAGSVSWTIKKAMTRAGVRGSAHSLRHWFATELLAAGADAVTVQQMLRHKSLRSTQVYTKVDFGQMRAAGARLPRPRPAAEPPAADPAATDAAELLAELRELRRLFAGLRGPADGTAS